MSILAHGNIGETRLSRKISAAAVVCSLLGFVWCQSLLAQSVSGYSDFIVDIAIEKKASFITTKSSPAPTLYVGRVKLKKEGSQSNHYLDFYYADRLLGCRQINAIPFPEGQEGIVRVKMKPFDSAGLRGGVRMALHLIVEACANNSNAALLVVPDEGFDAALDELMRSHFVPYRLTKHEQGIDTTFALKLTTENKTNTRSLYWVGPDP